MSNTALRVYLDYAAATPLRDEAATAMRPYLYERFANPSALYKEADEAKKALRKARESIARLLGVRPHEIIFTSGATEANNLAISGWARDNPDGRVLTTPIEHPSIYEPVQQLKKRGHTTHELPVDNEGFILLDNNNLRGPASKLVTLAHANPDIGTVQDMASLKEAVGGGALLHIDASQSPGLLPLNDVVAAAGLITLSGSKIYGPRGSGVLVVKDGVSLSPHMYGGGQERGLRPGTPDVAHAVGFAHALKLARGEQKKETARLSGLRDMIIDAVRNQVDNVLLTGPDTQRPACTLPARAEGRLPNHASFAFKDIEGEDLVVRLDAAGFAVGTGTACASGKAGVSRAVRTLKIPEAYQRGTLRVTLGRETTEANINAFTKALVETVREMRNF